MFQGGGGVPWEKGPISFLEVSPSDVGAGVYYIF